MTRREKTCTWTKANRHDSFWSRCDVLDPPILTGKPGGRRRVMKSRSLAKCAFEIAMRSMMGVTCSARDRGWLSLNHRVALNLVRNQTGPTVRWRSTNTKETELRARHFMATSYFWTLLVSSMGRPMSRPLRLNSGLKYSSAVMAVGL